jgi:hypothetical protein
MAASAHDSICPVGFEVSFDGLRASCSAEKGYKSIFNPLVSELSAYCTLQETKI